MATLLYTALTDLTVKSYYATWPCLTGQVLPLDPSDWATIRLLANGSIELAPDDAVDNTTPARILHGQPGLHTGVAN